MKKGIEKIKQRFLPIFLLLSIICGITNGCTQSNIAETHEVVRPWLKLEWEDKEYSLDQVTLSLSIGLFLNTENPNDLSSLARDLDSFYGACLYFCNADNAYLSDYNWSEYPALANHTLIREINAEDAVSDRYRVKKGVLGQVSYSSTEMLTIPRELLSEYNDSIFIKLVMIGIKDGQYVLASSPVSIGLRYRFIDENHIRFTSQLQE